MAIVSDSRAGRPERIAHDVLKAYSGGFPIKVKTIAKAQGCRVIEASLDAEVSGLLIRDNGSIVIAINNAESDTRQRFTIAHEIGHLLMHPGRPLLVDADVKINQRTPTNGFATPTEETEANRFAAALLMPAAEIERVLQQMRLPTSRVGEAIIAKLHRYFGVSEAAMQYRLMNLGLFIPQ